METSWRIACGEAAGGSLLHLSPWFFTPTKVMGSELSQLHLGKGDCTLGKAVGGDNSQGLTFLVTFPELRCSGILALRVRGRKGKRGKVCVEKILRQLGSNTQLQSLCSPRKPRLRRSGPKKSLVGTQERGGAAGLVGRTLHKTVTHRDAQKSVHSSNQRFLK